MQEIAGKGGGDSCGVVIGGLELERDLWVDQAEQQQRTAIKQLTESRQHYGGSLGWKLPRELPGKKSDAPFVPPARDGSASSAGCCGRGKFPTC